MELDIFDFLSKVEADGIVVPEIRKRIEEEIDKYKGMHHVLSGMKSTPELTDDIMSKMAKYLADLNLVKSKFRYPHLALIRLSDQENPEINQKVIQILKAIYSK